MDRYGSSGLRSGPRMRLLTGLLLVLLGRIEKAFRPLPIDKDQKMKNTSFLISLSLSPAIGRSFAMSSSFPLFHTTPFVGQAPGHPLYPKVDWARVANGDYAIVNPFDNDNVVYMTRREYLVQLRVSIRQDHQLTVLAGPGDKPVTRSTAPSADSKDPSPHYTGASPWIGVGRKVDLRRSVEEYTGYLRERFVAGGHCYSNGSETLIYLTVGNCRMVLSEWFRRNLLWHHGVSAPAFPKQGTPSHRLMLDYLAFVETLVSRLRHQGPEGVVPLLKGLLYIVNSKIGGQVIKSSRHTGCPIKLDRSGLPRCLPLDIRVRIRTGWESHKGIIRTYLSVFNAYKAIFMSGAVKLNTIMDPPLYERNLASKGNAEGIFNLFASWSKSHFWPNLRRQGLDPGRGKLMTKPIFPTTAGPNYSVAGQGRTLDAMAWRAWQQTTKERLSLPEQWFTAIGDLKAMETFRDLLDTFNSWDPVKKCAVKGFWNLPAPVTAFGRYPLRFLLRRISVDVRISKLFSDVSISLKRLSLEDPIWVTALKEAFPRTVNAAPLFPDETISGAPPQGKGAARMQTLAGLKRLAEFVLPVWLKSPGEENLSGKFIFMNIIKERFGTNFVKRAKRLLREVYALNKTLMSYKAPSLEPILGMAFPIHTGYEKDSARDEQGLSKDLHIRPSDEEEGDLVLGRLHAKVEPAGKIRVFAITDYWTQLIGSPIHHWMEDILRSIPMDCTFDQDGGLISAIKEINAEGHTSVWSLDLSSATDRIPRRLYKELFTHSKTLGANVDLWLRLLTDRYWKIDASVLNNLKIGPGLPKMAYVKYGTGQPMGALSSWPSMAIVHHALVQFSAYLVSLQFVGTEREKDLLSFTKYRVLGDDVFIWDTAVAARYLEVCEILGIEIKLAKSYKSDKALVNFANQTYVKTISLSPASLKEELKVTGLTERLAMASRLVKRNFNISVDPTVKLTVTHCLKLMLTPNRWVIYSNMLKRHPALGRAALVALLCWFFPDRERFSALGIVNLSLKPLIWVLTQGQGVLGKLFYIRSGALPAAGREDMLWPLYSSILLDMAEYMRRIAATNGLRFTQLPKAMRWFYKETLFVESYYTSFVEKEYDRTSMVWASVDYAAGEISQISPDVTVYLLDQEFILVKDGVLDEDQLCSYIEKAWSYVSLTPDWTLKGDALKALGLAEKEWDAKHALDLVQLMAGAIRRVGMMSPEIAALIEELQGPEESGPVLSHECWVDALSTDPSSKTWVSPAMEATLEAQGDVLAEIADRQESLTYERYGEAYDYAFGLLDEVMEFPCFEGPQIEFDLAAFFQEAVNTRIRRSYVVRPRASA